MEGKINIFLVGPMGAGKSTIGRKLAKELNINFLDSDKEISLRTGADVGWVFDVEGEEIFRNMEYKIIKEFTEINGIVLATGGGSVKYIETRKRLAASGVVVYLETKIEKQLARTQRDKKQKRPLLQVEFIQIEVLSALAKDRNFMYEDIADVKINANEHSTKAVAKKIIYMIATNYLRNGMMCKNLWFNKQEQRSSGNYQRSWQDEVSRNGSCQAWKISRKNSEIINNDIEDNNN